VTYIWEVTQPKILERILSPSLNVFRRKILAQAKEPAVQPQATQKTVGATALSFLGGRAWQAYIYVGRNITVARE
jgi:hypothetical protein